jgi:hypothetical protein
MQFSIAVRRLLILCLPLALLPGCDLAIRSGQLKPPVPAPAALSLLAPLTSPNSVLNPNILVKGITVGDTVRLFTNSSCSGTAVASAVASSTTPGLVPTVPGPGTYTFYAQAINPQGDASPCSSASVTYQAITVTHQGWLDIKAVGSTSPHADSGMSPRSASVTLTWNAPALSSGTIASYNVYRSLSAGAQDYSSPLLTGIAAGTRGESD